MPEDVDAVSHTVLLFTQHPQSLDGATRDAVQGTLRAARCSSEAGRSSGSSCRSYVSGMHSPSCSWDTGHVAQATFCVAAQLALGWTWMLPQMSPSCLSQATVAQPAWLPAHNNALCPQPNAGKVPTHCCPNAGKVSTHCCHAQQGNVQQLLVPGVE